MTFAEFMPLWETVMPKETEAEKPKLTGADIEKWKVSFANGEFRTVSSKPSS